MKKRSTPVKPPAIRRRNQAGVISLGCSKNSVDTEFLMGAMALREWEFTPAAEEADLLLVNTCSFLDSSVEESSEAIAEALEWKSERPGAVVVVAGCLVSRFGRALEKKYPDVDLFLRPGQISRFGSWLALPTPRPRHFPGGLPSYLPGADDQRALTSEHWAYLKISDGCDNRCGYCLIPSIRGRHRSRAPGSILSEAGDLVECGIREINIVGQDITRWKGRGRVATLDDLVGRIAALPGDFRLRLLYLHPARVTEKIVRMAVEEEKVLPYFDIPIQHASGKVLRAMNRPYGRRALGKMYDSLRRLVPFAALRTTVMVGYPGEGKREFRDLVTFLEDRPFENLGAFVFSPQEGTPAVNLPGAVPPEVAEERYHEIMSLQQRLSTELWKSKVGQNVEALILAAVEGEPNLWLGRTAWQAPEVDGHVVVSGVASPGDVVKIDITGSSAYDLEGTITQGAS